MRRIEVDEGIRGMLSNYRGAGTVRAAAEKLGAGHWELINILREDKHSKWVSYDVYTKLREAAEGTDLRAEREFSERISEVVDWLVFFNYPSKRALTLKIAPKVGHSMTNVFRMFTGNVKTTTKELEDILFEEFKQEGFETKKEIIEFIDDMKDSGEPNKRIPLSKVLPLYYDVRALTKRSFRSFFSTTRISDAKRRGVTVSDDDYNRLKVFHEKLMAQERTALFRTMDARLEKYKKGAVYLFEGKGINYLFILVSDRKIFSQVTEWISSEEAFYMYGISPVSDLSIGLNGFNALTRQVMELEEFEEVKKELMAKLESFDFVNGGIIKSHLSEKQKRMKKLYELAGDFVNIPTYEGN